MGLHLGICCNLIKTCHFLEVYMILDQTRAIYLKHWGPLDKISLLLSWSLVTAQRLSFCSETQKRWKSPLTVS